MKVLVLNGSPRGNTGMTWWPLDRFIRGMQDVGTDVETIQLAGKRIHYCTGEFACWFQSPGQCIHEDDMDTILASLQSADALVFATPVYVDGMTGLLKNCIDRMMPLIDPHVEIKDGHQRHPNAIPLPKRVALVSVCGFFEMDNFDPLIKHVQAICENLHATFSGAVLRAAAPMIPFTSIFHPFKTRNIARSIRLAGREFAQGENISAETAQAASAEIISKETYQKQANKYYEKLLKKRK